MTHSCRFIFVAGALSLLAIGWAADTGTVLDLDQVRLDVFPLQLEKVPLTGALGMIGVRANAVKGNLVLFGVEVFTEEGKEPLVTARIPGVSTLRAALTAVVQAVPTYTFEAVTPHMINFLPDTAGSNPDDLLNVGISRLSLVDVSPSNFIGNPARYIPELRAALDRGKAPGCQIGPGLSDKAPGITFQADAVTVRQTLNLVSEASVASAQGNRGVASGWVYLHEEFPSPDSPADSWRVHDVWDPRRHGN